MPVYLSRRSDLTDKPLAALVLSALEAVTGGFEYEDMFRFLKTGLAGVSDRQCDLLENYVLKWDIRGKAWVREEPWTGNPEGYGAELTPERHWQLQEVNRCRELVRPQLAALQAGLRAAGTARGKMEVLYRFLEDIHLPARLKERSDRMTEAGELQLAEEYRQLWEILCGIMDQFVEILGDAPLSNDEFLQLMKQMVSQYSVGTIPAALDQVHEDGHQLGVELPARLLQQHLDGSAAPFHTQNVQHAVSILQGIGIFIDKDQLMVLSISTQLLRQSISHFAVSNDNDFHMSFCLSLRRSLLFPSYQPYAGFLPA